MPDTSLPFDPTTMTFGIGQPVPRLEARIGVRPDARGQRLAVLHQPLGGDFKIVTRTPSRHISKTGSPAFRMLSYVHLEDF